MKKGVIIAVYGGLIVILIISALIISKNANEESNDQLRKDFSISIKKTTSFNKNVSQTYKEGQSICKNVEQLIEAAYGGYYTKKFKCVYSFTTNKTSVPNNTPFDRQTCLAMKGIWLEGEC